MPVARSACRICAAALCALWLLPTRSPAQNACAQEAAETATPDQDTLRVAAADTVRGLVVYETKRTTAEKILALPASVLHWATRPIGSAVIWSERNEVPTRVENFFWNDAHTFGVFPVARIGGAAWGAAGVAVRHERLFGTERRAEGRFLYTNSENLDARLSYRDPAPFGEETFVDVRASYRSDEDENLFLTSDLGAAGGVASYRVERAGGRLGLGADPGAPVGFRGLGWSVFGQYEYVDIGRGEGKRARRLPANLIEANTSAHLLTSGVSLLLDLAEGGRRGQPRTIGGRRFFAAYDYTTDLGDAPFSYHRLVGEGQQFVPLSFLGPYRRLAVRARVEKLFPGAGDQIPFYRLPVLGNADDLRGFEQNRFRGEGALLFTLEYHYPIWTSWDALLFVDSGQTFEAFDDLAPGALRWSGGFGLRLYAGSGVSLRLDVGLGGDGLRVFSGTGSNFTVSTRPLATR